MKRGTTYLFLLLVAASTQNVVENISNSELKSQMNQTENEQMFDNFRMKSTMDRILQSVEEIKKQVVENISNGDLKRQWSQIENEQMLDNCRMKSTMDRILQSVEANNKKMEDLMKKDQDDNLQIMDRILQSVEEIKKHVVENNCIKMTPRQLNQSENEQMLDKFQMKTMMDCILQISSVEENENKTGDLTVQVLPVKERDCQKIFATWPFIERNATMFFKAMGRTFYYNMTQWVTWYENRDWCSSRGMQMATLKTAEEQKQVNNTLRSKISRDTWFWVSASDIGRSAGQFHWADGTPLLESTWHSGEPNSHKANRKTCAYINTEFEKLFDYPCSGKSRTLCEVPELLANCL